VVQTLAVEEALEALRPSLAADGFSLHAGELSASGDVEIILEAKPDACLDCLVPDEFMVQMIADAIRKNDSSMVSVTLLKRGFEGQASH